jgi:hypothetical protein
VADLSIAGKAVVERPDEELILTGRPRQSEKVADPLDHFAGIGDSILEVSYHDASLARGASQEWQSCCHAYPELVHEGRFAKARIAQQQANGPRRQQSLD